MRLLTMSCRTNDELLAFGQGLCRQCRIEWYDGTIMMARTQISLDAETHRQARRRAADMGISLAEYLRRVVAADLVQDGRPSADVRKVFDLGTSSSADVASLKDAYLDEAVLVRRRR